MISQDKIRKALATMGNTLTLADIALAVEIGNFRVWNTDDSFLVVGIHHDALVFHLIVGDLQEILSMMEEALEWGREQGATRAVFLGRRGWVKSLIDLGWAVTGTLLMYERDI